MMSSSLKKVLTQFKLQKFISSSKFFERKYSTPAINIPTTKLFSENEVKAYHSVFPLIIETARKQAVELPEVSDRIEKILKSILPHHMLIEGLKVPCLYNVLDSSEKRTPEKILTSQILGWCVDFIISSWIINDDIFDGADTRWDYPCLHKQDDIKLQAINDAVILVNLAYAILKEFCSDYSWYSSAMKLMHDVCLKAAYGQTLHHMCKTDGKLRFEVYTRENFDLCATYRIVYPGYILPTMLATYCSKNYDDDLPKKAQKVFSELGKFMAIQDDMVDDQEDRMHPSSKSDIGTGQLTWLIVNALEMASPTQKNLLYQHYGQSNLESVSIVHTLYDELNVYDFYQKFKERSFEYICATNKNLNISEAHRRCFYKLIEILYERPHA